jgi:hypothetical protein
MTPNSFGWLILGSSQVNTPIFGGTLVPSPDFTLFAAIDPQGSWSIQFPWPSGYTPGTGFWWQFAAFDTNTPFGFSASDALRSGVP